VTEFDGGEGAVLAQPDGTFKALFVPGGSAPAGGTFGTSLANKVALNDSGNVAMSAPLDRGDGEGTEILFYDRAADKWSVIMQPGMPAPDGGTFESAVSFCTMNNANDIAFAANVTESSAGPAGTGVFLYSAGQTRTVARPGTKIGSGALTECRRAQISVEGQHVTFEGAVEGVDGYGAYVWSGGTLTELASANVTAPDSDTKFSEMRGTIANSKGDVAMLGLVGDAWGAYLYTAADRKLITVAKPGDELPGGGKLATAESVGRNSIRIGEDGSVYFAGTLESDAGAGVFVSKAGTLAAIARTGQELTGVGTAENLANSGFSSWGLGNNTKGQVAFPVLTTDGKTHLVLATPNP
jgi:hypothetical protein